MDGADSASAVSARDGELHTIEFETDEVSHAHVDVSPDGKTLIFDLLGDLYTLPIEGGMARPLTAGSAWDSQPQYSPDGRRIAFVSDRSGSTELWTINVGGSDATRMSFGGYSLIANGQKDPVKPSIPVWMPGGGLVHENRVLEAPGRGEPIPYCYARTTADVSRDGRYLFVEGVQKVDLKTGRSESIGAFGVFPRLSPDGEFLAYVAGRPEELRYRHLASGREHILVRGIGWTKDHAFSFTPDGRSIVIPIEGKLNRIDIRSGERYIIPMQVHVAREVAAPLHHGPRRIADEGEVRTQIVRWPTRAPGGDKVVYSAFGRLYSTSISNGRTDRLTASDEYEFAPAVSPDGKWVAYVTWSDVKMGHVMLVPVEGGTPRQLTATSGRYINPAWAVDGTKLAFVADYSERRMGLYRFGKQPPLALYWIPVSKTASIEESPRQITLLVPMEDDRNQMSRFYPVPMFSADGRRVFFNTAVGESGNKKAGPAQLSASLDGHNVLQHVFLPRGDEATMSPDGKHIAIVSQDRLWVAKMPAFLDNAPAVGLDLRSAALLTETSPTYISWVDRETLMWAEASRIYQRRLNDVAPKLLAEVDIRHARAIPQGGYALVNARVITMNGKQVIERGTVVVRNGRIAQVGASEGIAIPGDLLRFDLQGKTIIPGLIDVHAHYHHARIEIWQRQSADYVGNLAYGVTTIYDPQAITIDTIGQAEMVEAGEILGPRVYSSGNCIDGAENSGPPFRSIASLDAARAAVKYHARYANGPLKEYMMPRREQRQWLLQAAREQGVLLTSHPLDYTAILTSIADGYTAFEHKLLGRAPRYDDVVQYIARSGIHYTPTLNMLQYHGLQTDLDDAKLRRFSSDFVIDDMKERREWGMRQPNLLQQELPAIRELARIADLGGFVSVGAHGNGPAGLNTHWEMWSLTLGGMSTQEALKAATVNGAKKLDLDTEIGSIEPGKLADMIVLNANPLDDIRNSADIQYVIIGGFLFEGSSMTRIWPTRKVLEPWPWRAAEIVGNKAK